MGARRLSVRRRPHGGGHLAGHHRRRRPGRHPRHISSGAAAHPLDRCPYAFAGGGLFLALGSGPGLWAARDYPLVAWGWIVGLALIPSLGGYALFTLGLRGLPASQVSVIATWEVVTAALLGWPLFGELLTAAQITGAALVCFGIAWIQRAEG